MGRASGGSDLIEPIDSSRHEDALAALGRAEAERDAWMQELFESERHVAALMRERVAACEAAAGDAVGRAWLRAHADRLEGENARLCEEAGRLRQEATQHRDDNRRLAAANAASRAEVAALRSSRSWRLTRPARELARSLRRLLQWRS